MSNILHEQKQILWPTTGTVMAIRGLDIVGSALGLLFLLPVFAVIALVIKATSAGPVFYPALRVGQYGRPITVYKFRSMVKNAAGLGPGITATHDPRITGIGRFLRRSKLDELPQLFNVLRGDMSLVGPRPEDPRYVALYSPEQRQILKVRPGMTSYASLYYKEEETLLTGEDWEHVYRTQIMSHKLALDLRYLQGRTVWSDLQLIIKTVRTVFIRG